jgi:hypothetical protein
MQIGITLRSCKDKESRARNVKARRSMAAVSVAYTFLFPYIDPANSLPSDMNP